MASSHHTQDEPSGLAEDLLRRVSRCVLFTGVDALPSSSVRSRAETESCCQTFPQRGRL
jgi:hypothetical protein